MHMAHFLKGICPGRTGIRMPGLFMAVMLLAACGGDSSAEGTEVADDGSTAVAGSTAATDNAEGLPVLDVYLTRTCGCCGGWVEHSREQGFHSLRNYLDYDELNAVKAEHGIAPRLQSCHTSVSADGYVFEGHIPARVIQQFLADVPEGAMGLAVPGMPTGSPGMEMGDRFDPYDVLLIREDGTTAVYTHIASADQQ